MHDIFATAKNKFGDVVGKGEMKIPRWLVGAGAAATAVAALVSARQVTIYILKDLQAESWLSLPVLAILGMLLLLTILAAVLATFGHFG